jgi:hypothetical protein
MKKRCGCCKLDKDLTDFHKNRSGKFGVDVYCKRCYKVWKAEHFVESKPRIEYAKQQRNSPHGRYVYTRNQAKVRKKEWDLAETEYRDAISKPCFYCSGPLPIGGSGIDRLDNTKGYVSGNIVPCCYTCNNLKNSTLTWQETLVAVKAIKEYRKCNEKEKFFEVQINFCNSKGLDVVGTTPRS